MNFFLFLSLWRIIIDQRRQVPRNQTVYILNGQVCNTLNLNILTRWRRWWRCWRARILFTWMTVCVCCLQAATNDDDGNDDINWNLCVNIFHTCVCVYFSVVLRHTTVYGACTHIATRPTVGRSVPPQKDSASKLVCSVEPSLTFRLMSFIRRLYENQRREQRNILCICICLHFIIAYFHFLYAVIISFQPRTFHIYEYKVLYFNHATRVT